MNNRYLVVGFAFLFFALSVYASCADPDLNIVISTNKTFESDVFDVNLIYSANPPVNTLCMCLFGYDCGMKWQYLKDGNWTQIPQTSAQDLNCSGNSCSTGTGKPTEDRPYTRHISCVDQDTYQVRGFLPLLNKATEVKTVYCYQKLACIPPSAGNFYLNETCTYQNVPVSVDGNFNILSSGRSIHHNSDVNFFSNGSHFLNIKDGGRIDLNQSMIFAGLAIEQGLLGGLFGLIGLGLAGIYSFFTRRKGVVT